MPNSDVHIVHWNSTQDCWLQFHVSGKAVHRGLGHDADDQKKALQIVFLDGEEPEGLEHTDVLCEERESQVGLLPAFRHPLGHCALKVRYLARQRRRSILPGKAVIVCRWIDKVEVPEIDKVYIYTDSFASIPVFTCRPTFSFTWRDSRRRRLR